MELYVKEKPKECSDCMFCEKYRYGRRYCSLNGIDLGCFDRTKECPLKSLAEHDAEKEKEYKYKLKAMDNEYKKEFKTFEEDCKHLYKTETKKAIDELEKVKEYNRGLVYSSSLIDKFIDQQIKSLKGET